MSTHLGPLADQLLRHGYQIQQELGRGGMGVVYLATQVSLNRPVAIKVLPKEGEALADLGRFRREALTIRQIEHPNVVRIIDLHLDDAPLFLVLELVEGARSLEEGFEELPPGREERLKVVRGILDGLVAVHDLKVVHRDLKPGNVLIDKSAAPKLIDFGLARSLDSDETRQTKDGQIMGTLAYMSPEQLRGEDADLTSDVYSFGLIAMELIAGMRLFTGAASASHRVAYVDRVTQGVPDILRFCPDLDPRLARVIVRCVAMERAQRPSSARAILDQWPTRDVPRRKGGSRRTAVVDPLKAAVPPVPPASRRWPVGLLALCLILASVVFGLRNRTPPPVPRPVSTVAAPDPPQVTLRVDAAHIRVAVRTDRPAEMTVKWRGPTGPGVLSRSLSAQHDVAVPVGDFASDLDVVAGGERVDIEALLQPRLRRLLDLLRPVEISGLLQKVRPPASRSRGGLAAVPVTEVLPGGVVQAVADLGPLLAEAVAKNRDPVLKLELASRLFDVELLETWATRQGLQLASRVTPRLPAGWAQRIDAPDDPKLPRFTLEGQQQGDRVMTSTVNGAKPATEWWVYGAGWDYLNWSGSFSMPAAPSGSPASPPPVDREAKSAAQECVIVWQHPADAVGRHERLMFSVEFSGGVHMALSVNINGKLKFPLVTRETPRGKPGAAWLLSRLVPPEALVAGRNQLVLRPFALPGSEVTPVWIGGVSFIGYRRPGAP